MSLKCFCMQWNLSIVAMYNVMTCLQQPGMHDAWSDQTGSAVN